MKKVILSVLSMLAVAMAAEAQIPAFRSRGYKGNVSYTNQYLVWQGVETSHGYRFDSHHYLGGGAGVFLAPIDDVPPAFAYVFVDYTGYFLNKKNTPFAAIKTGVCQALDEKNADGDFKFSVAATVEPVFGWSWGLKSGKGLLLSISSPLFISGDRYSTTVQMMPKLSFGFEF